MSIIVPNDFKGENTIAQVNGTVGGVNSTLQGFIDKYEPKFLRELLGTVLANEFVAGLAVTPVEDIDPKWIALRDETDIKQMIIDYVYFFYMRNQTTSTAGMSEVKGKTDNATPVNSVFKQDRAWNEMANMARFFDLDVAVYPDFNRVHWRRYSYWRYGCGVSEIYYNIGIV